MQSAPAKYQHSGNVGSGYIVIPLVGIPATLLLSVIYAYVCVYNPLAGKISFLIPLFYGVAVGFCVERAIVWAKCRSRTVILAAAAGFAALAVYAGWASFEYALLNRFAAAGTPTPTLAMIFCSPLAVWRIAMVLNSTGWYSVFGATPSGIILGLLWIVEAGTIMVCAFILPMAALKKVFCEQCNEWCEEKTDLARFVPTTDPVLTDRIKGGELTALAELPLSPSGSNRYLRVDSQRCKKCSETATFQVKQIRMEAGSDGKLEEKSDDLSDPVVLTPDVLRQFQEALARGKKEAAAS